MNEDEAFIRAIVDTPGDDTARLVYADWLDDRDDPRGPYLRAEYAGNKTGDIARLREHAVGLDPVWVARVSRPPVGVCCDYFTITDRGPLVTQGDLNLFERTARLRLPLEYRAFLLNVNGGNTPAAWLPTSGNDAGLELSGFYALQSSKGDPRAGTPGRLEGLEGFGHDARPLLPIGDGGGNNWLIVMDLTSPNSEILMFEDYIDNALITLADSFARFLSLIEPHGHEE